MSNLAMKTPSTYESSGGRLVTADGRTLPLKGAALAADAKGGVARVVLEQRFTNPYAEPLAVTYLMPLPADGAVSGYAFTIGERRIVGEVDRRQAARERFEQAIVEGRTAALVDQERSSLFTQEIGNIPPGAEVVAELSIDQKLAWLPDGMWEWRFPTVVAPRYLGEPGRVADPTRVTVEVADRPLPVRLGLSVTIRDAVTEGRRPESPSHAIRAVEGGGRFEVSLADDSGVALDRDVVVRWPAIQPRVGLSVDVARGGARGSAASFAYGLLTVVPPAPRVRPAAIARDLIVLLDTSGSMGGQPLDQARRVVSALVDTLTEEDRLEMIEFSSAPRRWKSKPVAANRANRADALKWLGKLRASGGTEMRSGILEALAPLRDDSQRQIVLITDGLIGSEEEVIEALCDRLPAPSRVHVVGVGSGVNRSLTGPASRAGRGVELVIGIGEDAERAAQRLVARTHAPLVTELSVTGSAVVQCAPERLPDLFAGSPSLLSLRLRPEGGELVVSGRTAEGRYVERLSVPPAATAAGSPAVVALFGREAVEDAEMRIAAGKPRREHEQEIERLGLEFQIATRLTSWVAVSDAVTVDPTAASRREVVPQELPFGMSVEGLGLRGAAASPSMQVMASTGAMAPSPLQAAPAATRVRMAKKALSSSPLGGLADGVGGLLEKAKGALGRRDKADVKEEAAAPKARASMPQRQSAPPPPAEYRPEPLPVAADEAEVDAEAVDAAYCSEPTFAAEEDAEVAAEAGDGYGHARGEGRVVAAEPSPAGPGAGPRRLGGRIVLRKERELYVELTVDAAGLEWDPAGEVWLELANGWRVKVEADLSRSTRPVSAGAGMVLRLALRLPEEGASGEIRRVALTSGALALEIVL